MKNANTSLLPVTLAALLATAATTTAFAPCPSSFVGRASSVCVKEVDIALPTFGHDSMTMKVPFLRKPRFPNVFRRRSGAKEEEGAVAILDRPTSLPTTLDRPTLATETEGVKAVSTTLTPAAGSQVVDDECVAEEELSETQKLMKQVKEAGLAGVISYALWELGFWTVSVPVCIFGYREVTGHWPDLSDKDDIAKLSAEAFAFVNFARFAVPLRIGLALSTTPWIQQNIVDRFIIKDEKVCDPAAPNGSGVLNGVNGADTDKK